jgi:cytoskeleton protein RodZ
VSDLNDHNREIHEATSNIPPGARLRQAREARNLGLEEVASHLRLSVDKIASLERGEVEEIAAPVFVVGYLRAYAKLVGLPGDEVIADFDALAKMDSPSMDPSSSPAVKDYGRVATPTIMQRLGSIANSGNKTILLGLVIVVLVVIYVVGKNSVNTKPTTVDEQLTTDTRQEKITGSMPDNGIGKELSIKDTKSGSANTQGNKNTINQPAGTVSAGRSELSLYFNEESWVEVTDATGQRLLYRLGKAGMSETIVGVAPFDVQLGYAPGVSIFYNGKPYDLSRYANRRTAKFQIGSAGDSKTGS